MPARSLSHLSDPSLLKELSSVLARRQGDTAEMLLYLAEVDERRLYLPAAYPSMHRWCVGVLHFSDEAAAKRIHAARAARKHPALYAAVANGRLHLSAVILLAPHLTPETADELIAAATHRSKLEIERLLAERGRRRATAAESSATMVAEHAPGRVESSASDSVAGALAGSPMSGDVAEHAPGRAGRLNTRRVEFDHVQPHGKGGLATVENTRLLCRAHNQYVAEQEYGAAFMQGKREQAKRASEAQKARNGQKGEPSAAPRAAKPASTNRSPAPDDELTLALEHLGFRRQEIAQATQKCESLADAPLEQRVRLALAYLAPRSTRRNAATSRPAA